MVNKKQVVKKEEFDSLMTKLLKAEPIARKEIRIEGKRSPKPILSK